MPDTIAQTGTRSDLFQPVQLGPYLLANRIVMAPLTRSRAGADGVPCPLMAEYYAQRASAGLIIAEGTNISAQARGYDFTPGLYTAAQVEGWRQVTEAVHTPMAAESSRSCGMLGEYLIPRYSQEARCRWRLRRSARTPPHIPKPASNRA